MLLGQGHGWVWFVFSSRFYQFIMGWDGMYSAFHCAIFRRYVLILLSFSNLVVRTSKLNFVWKYRNWLAIFLLFRLITIQRDSKRYLQFKHGKWTPANNIDAKNPWSKENIIWSENFDFLHWTSQLKILDVVEKSRLNQFRSVGIRIFEKLKWDKSFHFKQIYFNWYVARSSYAYTSKSVTSFTIKIERFRLQNYKTE